LFGGDGGLVVCKWGELGLGRRRRNRGAEGRHRGNILTFSDGFTDGNSVGDSILTEKPTRHRTDLPFRIPQWFRWHFKRWTGHVTVRICYFESLSDSVGNLNGEPVTSLYGAVVLNPSVIPSVKITSPKPLRQRPTFFFLIRNVFVGSYRLNYGRKRFHR
jgi:hypothetical protein